MRVRSIGRSCRTGAPIHVAYCSSKLFLQNTGATQISCPHADNDRIAAIRTNESSPRCNCINHITAAALAEKVRSMR